MYSYFYSNIRIVEVWLRIATIRGYEEFSTLIHESNQQTQVENKQQFKSFVQSVDNNLETHLIYLLCASGSGIQVIFVDSGGAKIKPMPSSNLCILPTISHPLIRRSKVHDFSKVASHLRRLCFVVLLR